MHKVCFIIPFFGEKLPSYFPYFLKSILWNPSINFIFFTNIKLYIPENSINITVFEVSLKDIENLINEKLDLTLKIEHPYKLCDYRPLFGIIFKEYIVGYDFWGYCDIDIIFSNLRSFFTNEVLDEYEVVSCRHSYQTGFLSLYRNTARVNTLFLESNNYPDIFYNGKSFCADECGTDTYSQILACYPNYVVSQKFETEPSIDSITHILRRKDIIVSIKDEGEYFKNRVHEFYFIDENEAFDEITVSAMGITSKKIVGPLILIHLMYIKRRVFFEIEDIAWESSTIFLNKYKMGNHAGILSENNSNLLHKKFKINSQYLIEENILVNSLNNEKIKLEETHLLLKYYKNHQFIANDLIVLLKRKQFGNIPISKIEDAVLEMIFYFYSKRILEIV